MEKYLNFPISFFTDPFRAVKSTMDRVMDYAVYRHSLKLEMGTDDEKIKSSANYFDISLCAELVEENYNSMCQKYDTEAPNVSLHRPIMWEYYEQDKNEFQIACFRAFCAIKSIIGGKDNALTNKKNDCG